MTSDRQPSDVLARRPRGLGRRGLTLLEVIVAMSISAALLIGARSLAGAIADAADGIRDRAEAIDRHANGQRILRRLAGQIEAGTMAEPFGGDERRVEFTSACIVPEGWSERCRAAFAVEPDDRGLVLMVRLETGEALPTARAGTHMSIRYIGSARRGGTWFRVWEPGIAMPAALGIILDRDTLIVPIGETG